MLNCLELYKSWYVFWLTFLSVGYIFPTNTSITRPRSKMTLYKIYKRLFFNAFITGCFIPIISYFPTIIKFSTNWQGYFLKYVCTIFIIEMWFYYSHRLMHNKYFYKWHSDHHAFISPHALSGLYCSGVEMIFVNQLSLTIPIQILNFTSYESLILSFIVSLNILKGHSGLYLRNDIPEFIPEFIYQNYEHDEHHRKMKFNYGIFYLLDRVHGTYKVN